MDQAASSPLQEELGRAPSSQELKAYRQKRRRARASLSSCLPPEPVTLLLFYTYAPTPMSKHRQTEAVRFSLNSLKKNNLTGRLRIAREGYNGTLTGSKKGVRAFTASLEMFDCATFGNQRVDFKYVDGLPHNQALKGLKCWPVTEIVTYGFDPRDAPLDAGGHHLSPQLFHAAITDPDAVVVDVRNFNETIIGRFAPAAGAQVDRTEPREADREKGVVILHWRCTLRTRLGFHGEPGDQEYLPTRRWCPSLSRAFQRRRRPLDR